MSKEHCASSVGQAQVYCGEVKGLWPMTLIMDTPSHTMRPGYICEDDTPVWLPPSGRSGQYLSPHPSSTQGGHTEFLPQRLQEKEAKDIVDLILFFWHSLDGWIHRPNLQTEHKQEQSAAKCNNNT